MIDNDVSEIGRAIFEETADALFLFDPETDTLRDVNPAVERLTGFSRRSILEHPATYWFRFTGEDKGGMQRLRQAARRTGPFSWEDGYVLRTAQDGVWIPVAVSLARLHVQPSTLALLTARDLREQRAARGQLQKKEAELRAGDFRFQAVIDHCPAVIYIKDLEGHYLASNRQHLELVRRPREKVVGQDDFALFPPEVARAFRANDEQVRTTGMATEREECVPQENGVHTYISLKFPLRDSDGNVHALCGISTDITQRKRAEEERKRIFDLSLDMLCTADFNGHFLSVNPAWERILGWTAGQLLARPYLDFVHPDDRDATISEARKLAEGGYQTIFFENRYRCADGSYKWLQWVATALTDLKTIYGAARDVTQKKLADRQLAQTAAELQQLATNLEATAASERRAHQELKKAQSRLVQSEKLIALGQLVAGVAHEINNPLSFVITNLAVLERDLGAVRELLDIYQEAKPVLFEQAPALFKQIEEWSESMDLTYTLENLEGVVARSRDGVQRIQHIVRDLRHFARLDEGGLHQVNLNSGIESTANIVHGLAENKKIKLILDLGKLPLVRCYPARINQVVLNLLTNAIDACPSGSEVTVRSLAVADGVEIHVIDNGPGMPSNVRDRVFEPFFTTKPPGKGTGLGLSISHGIVEDHAGRIGVESAPGKGAHFTVWLPVEPPGKGGGA